MAITFVELKEKLIQLEETILLEVLEISSEDIVNRFEDKIEQKFEELVDEFPDEETD